MANVTSRARLCVRAFVVFVAGLPRRRLGGAGGPAAPVGGGPGELRFPGNTVFIETVRSYTIAPLLGGLMGGSHKVLLDLLVLTDTIWGQSGSKGLALYGL
ncbi:MAG: hypothetical protein [Microvirus sp.]|nr:MAG: hypothetical protein [Microvirus sp.]